VAVALAVPSALATAKLYFNLRSDLEELLPRSAPSVLALDELRLRMPGLLYLGVLVDVGAADNLPAASVCSMTWRPACATTRRTWCGRFAWGRSASGVSSSSTSPCT